MKDEKKYDCKLFQNGDCEGYRDTYCDCDGSGCYLCKNGHRSEDCTDCPDFDDSSYSGPDTVEESKGEK